MGRSTRRILSAVTTLAAVTAVLAGGSTATAADQAAPTVDSQQPLGSVDPADLPAAEPRQGLVKVGTNESCSTIERSARAALGGATKACVETKPMKKTDVGVERTAALAAAEAEACDIAQPGYWTWSRTGGICLNGMEVTYTLYSDKGAVLGTGLMNVKSSMELSATSATWNELITVGVTAVTGEVTSLNIAFDVACTSACSATTNTPWSGAKSLGPGAQASGSVTYSSGVASGARDSFQTQYHMYVTTTGSIPTQPDVDWSSPAEAPIRCDAELTAPGCVIPERRGVLEYSLSDPTHDSAAAVYGFAQGNLRDWAPLTRLDGIADANRARTCGAQSSDPFVPMPDYVPNDSCDEFPFAGSFEGGTDGAQCADILPLYEDGQWWIYEARTDKPVTYTEPCVRGHVDLTANESAGGKYGAFVKNQRILDSEKYDVNVVA